MAKNRLLSGRAGSVPDEKRMEKMQLSRRTDIWLFRLGKIIAGRCESVISGHSVYYLLKNNNSKNEK